MSSKFYNVLLFRGIPSLYTYQEPALNTEHDCLGKIVTVPIGKATCKGLVVSITTENTNKSLKSIYDIDDQYCDIPQPLISLLVWFSEYYQCTPYKSFQTFGLLQKKRNLKSADALSPTSTPYELTEEQSHCVNAILSTPRAHHEFYIHGVTGSGKTEVYMHLVAAMLNEEKSSIILVPEIALTPQYVRAFTERFGSRVFVLHSGLTKVQKEKEWNKIIQSKSAVVIGARSSLFCPVNNLGLIVVDEEHEPSYKQDSHPRYDVHPVAEKRAELENCYLVYGSATPRIETYYRFQAEKKPIYNLFTRISGHALPHVELIDMKEAYRNQEGGLISKALEEEISMRLEKKEKTLILINRRGFSSYISCQKCGTVCQCPHCHLSFTYHQDKSFRCHRCGTIKASSYICSNCKSNSLAFTGTGIQKIELELTRLFPNAALMRLDKDTAKTSKQMENILDAFRKSGDILLGTQLIAKGHHIDAVTLVGVLGIDQTLNMPDFRSPERTFQLLTQVAGRAGRGKIAGYVIIQTLQPDHYAIQHASKHDFFTFYNQELRYRKSLLYTPFRQLIHIILSSKSQSDLQKHGKIIHSYLHKELSPISEQCSWIGPVSSPIEFIRNHYRHSIVIKHDNELSTSIRTILSALPKSTSVRVIIDFDPYSLL